MFVVPCPLAMVALAGAVQVYDVAPARAAIEYGTFNWLAQAVVAPVTVPGVNGTERTVALLEGLMPHVFPAVTRIVPEVNAGLKSTVTLFVPCPVAIVA